MNDDWANKKARKIWGDLDAIAPAHSKEIIAKALREERERWEPLAREAEYALTHWPGAYPGGLEAALKAIRGNDD